jgi:DNA mismatch repair ATPase MutS
MMTQYRELKRRFPDHLLLFRLGDFYELFLEDAEQAAPLLDIALTSRDKGKPDAVPMCGVPVHSVDGYVKRLVELGHRVAICEQVEDARLLLSGQRPGVPRHAGRFAQRAHVDDALASDTEMRQRASAAASPRLASMSMIPSNRIRRRIAHLPRW